MKRGDEPSQTATAGRYIDTFEAEEKIDIAAVQSEIDVLEGELLKIKAKMKGYFK